MLIVRRGIIRSRLVGGTLALLAACAPPLGEEQEVLESTRQELVAPSSVDPSRELIINDVSVVDDPLYTTWNPNKTGPNDPEGSWSFGRLIDNMVPESMRNPRGRSQFILLWLKTWERDQTVNQLTIPARPAIRTLVINPWRAASGCTGDDDACVLDLAKAPFRLLAIANRPDLRKVPMGSDEGSAGQGRFVFGVLGAGGVKLPFTVIFEYQLPIARRADMLTWARRWHALSTVPLGSAYNARLQAVTREFTRRNAVPCRVNGSGLLQLRTNEVPLSPVEPKLWEMREFVLGRGGLLRPATVKQEVDASLNGSAALGSWVERNTAAILAGTHDVPLCYQGAPFRAAAAPVPTTLAWVVPGAPEQVRHAFALATCSGCHKSETATNFLHVRSREPGSPALLSPFLTDQLSLSGPRVTDFATLLSTADENMLRDGQGRDHQETQIDSD
jgi:hypothetical protein